MPAVVLTGARQTGKSTLVQGLVPGGRRYLTLDDMEVQDAARGDPEVLPGGPLRIAAACRSGSGMAGSGCARGAVVAVVVVIPG